MINPIDSSPYNAQYPLPADGDSVYCKDIDLDNSDIGDFSGDICDFFDSLTTVSTNATADNPKTITIAFERSIGFYAIGLGCDDIAKNFSNVKIQVLGSAGEVRHTIDFSADNTKRNSQTFAIASDSPLFGGNGIVIEFHTADAVSLSNIIIFKTTNVNSRLQATSQATNEVENINSLGGALNIHQLSLHHELINRHFIDFDSATENPSVAISAGDTVVLVADTTGFTLGADMVIMDAGGDIREQHFVITAVVVNTSIAVDRPIDIDYTTSATLEIVMENMNVAGSLASPVIYELSPPSDELWHMERILISMTDDSPMDDAKFGGLGALDNGVVFRQNKTVNDTISVWKSNQSMIEDMYDVTYSSRAPAGSYGLRGRFSFSNAGVTMELDGSLGDKLEILIQDDLTDLTTFKIKVQGHAE